MRRPHLRHARPGSRRGWTAAAVVAVLGLAACGGAADERLSIGAPPTAPVAVTGPVEPSPPTRPVPSSARAVPGPTTTLPEIGLRSGLLEDLALDPAPAPIAVLIDAIDVLAPTRQVGIDADGELDVPDADDVGWYRFGPSPGEAGSAVLAGHVDHAGREGVFFDLDALVPGDEVVVAYDDGSRRTFVVARVERFDKDVLPTDDLFARGGEPRLALITCGGDFDDAERSYLDNLVVTAVPA